MSIFNRTGYVRGLIGISVAVPAGAPQFGDQDVVPGAQVRLQLRLVNSGTVALPPNRARLTFELDNGATFAGTAISNVHNGGTANRSCARPTTARIECTTQSNVNTIAVSGAANYSNFYAQVLIPADAVPGTVYHYTTSLDFDPVLYTDR